MDDNTDFDTWLLGNFDAALQSISEDNRVNLYYVYSDLTFRRFQQRGQLHDLEEAIDKMKWALQETTPDDKDFAARLDSLGVMIGTRYERTGKMDDLEDAIRLSRQAVEVTPKDYSDLLRRLNNLGTMLSRRYEQTGKMDDLEEAIQVARQVVEVTPKDYSDLAVCLNNLGNKLKSRYKRTAKIDDLEEAIQVARQVVKVTPEDYPDLAGRLNNLGNMLESRHERTRKIDDLEEALQIARRVVEVTPKDYSDLAAWLNNLGIGLGRRYERTGNLDNLREAIEVARQAVEVTSKGHPDLASSLKNLGNMLGLRYERTRKMDDLKEAIQVARQVVKVTPEDHPDLASRLNNLGNKLRRRYERTGKMDDLEEAIQVARQVVKVTPKDHPDLATWLNNLGVRLESRYKRTGKMGDLEEAIQVTRQAVKVTPEDHPDLAARLNNLGNKLGLRYEQMGKMNDLEAAIQAAQQAVEVTLKDHPDLAVYLNNLGNMLGNRYEQTGKMDNLEDAIQVAQQAVEVTPKDHPNLAAWLNGLGSRLGYRYGRIGEIYDLEKAIQVTQQAVEVTPEDHPNLVSWLSNLGGWLSCRYKQTRKMGDLEEAIQVTQRAVEDTPKDHPNLAARLNNLGIMLESRYERIRKMEDLEEAIQLSRRAVEVTPEDHPDLTGRLINLSRQLLSLDSPMELEALELLLRAWKCSNAPPLMRIRAAREAIQLLQAQMDYIGAYKISTEAIDLLPRVHSRSLTLEDQQYVVSLFSGLANNACSLALQTREPPAKAVEILERGRGVILGLLMDDRRDNAELKAAHPTLHAQYESLRAEVNRTVDNITDQIVQQVMVKRRPQAIKELENCIEDIQKLPNFGQFQRAPTAEQMKKASEDGNIVVINITDLRSDAIVISSIGFSAVPLPRLDASSAKGWINKDLTMPSSNDPAKDGKNNKIYRQFLSWLWQQCVKPIFQEAQYKPRPSMNRLPRVWWIGTGFASSFPFHAAGDSSTGPTESTYYWAVSSYTPSIKALIYARERTPATTLSSNNRRKLLVISMANTPDANGLPGVEKEKTAVVRALGNSVSVEVLEQPNVASVLHQIQQCTIAHFACHGVSNSSDPSESGLLLQTSATEPRQDILSVRKISQTHLAGGEIAYLSACSTAENRAASLVDEVLHVVSGFQVAGFRHVVGCLWPSSDSVCVEVAESFYSEIRRGGMEWEDRAVAAALHKAVVKICESKEYSRRPLQWAQYVHYGA